MQDEIAQRHGEYGEAEEWMAPVSEKREEGRNPDRPHIETRDRHERHGACDRITEAEAGAQGGEEGAGATCKIQPAFLELVQKGQGKGGMKQPARILPARPAPLGGQCIALRQQQYEQPARAERDPRPERSKGHHGREARAGRFRNRKSAARLVHAARTRVRVWP